MFPIYINDGNHEVPDTDIFYIIGKEGIFLRKKLGRIDAILPVDEISVLGNVNPAAKYDLPKIPALQFAKIVAFFKEVHKQHRSEAIVLVHFNENTEEFRLQIPHQKVSPASLDYIRTEVYPGFTNVSTIHSHSSMSAFHSGIDDKDEEDVDGLHITVGHLNWDDGRFDLSVSIVFNGHRFMVDADDYIDGLIYDEIEVMENTKYPKYSHFGYYTHLGKGQTASVKKPGYRLDIPKSRMNFKKKWMNYVTVKHPTYMSVGGSRVTNIVGGGRYNNYTKNQSIIDSIDLAGEFPDMTGLADDDGTEYNPCTKCVFSDYKLLHEVNDDDIDGIEGIEENYRPISHEDQLSNEGKLSKEGGE